jgi:hypothetical protein
MANRPDSVGFFWEDLPVVKPPPKEKIKRTPPERTWENPDNLPGLAEALAFDVPMFTDMELYQSMGKPLVLDTEIYANYFLAAFRCPFTMKTVTFELSEETNFQMNLLKLKWILENFCIVDFNGKRYDIPITTCAVSGAHVAALKWMSDQIIVEQARPHDIMRAQKVKKIEVNEIDLIEVCPLSGSLKKYAARIHAKRMQDLPFHPSTILNAKQRAIVRWYCVQSDIPATIQIFHELEEQIALRYKLTETYKIDLRSKSDAQIAESVIAEELRKLNGVRPQVPEIQPGTVYHYKVPSYLKFETPLMQWALNVVRNGKFIVSESGYIHSPPEVDALNLQIAYSVYRMGMGGLHSSEQKTTHISDHTFRILDRDVESFYPRIILNQKLYPQHLGPNFLRVYETIVNRRVHAKKMSAACKKTGDKEGAARWRVESESLKITINGSFGKLGSMWSMLYAPDLLMQVTITGQLSLLMLIERMELALIPVVSANTDGIVMRVSKDRQLDYERIIVDWEMDTAFITEETEYAALMSRDVNNYIAIKNDGEETKNKGIFANPWAIKRNIFQFHKNPQNLICTTAIEKFITKRTPIELTIRSCKDITQFVTVRDAKGGGVKIDAEGKTQLYMGKMLRWYYANDEVGEIVYAKSGNKVARSEGAKPLMDLPDVFPDDVNYDWYIKEAESMLAAVGYA